MQNYNPETDGTLNVKLERQQHSRKPDIFRKYISDIYGVNRKKIEVFARKFEDSKHFENWDCTGLEFDGKDVRQFIKDPVNLHKYQIIYIDPPWQFNDAKKIRKDGVTPTKGIGACNHYGMLSNDELIKIKWDNLACLKGAYCLIWATGTHLPIAIEILKQNNFEYVNIIFNWVKKSKNGNPVLGCGNHSRIASEFCVLGKINNPPLMQWKNESKDQGANSFGISQYFESEE